LAIDNGALIVLPMEGTRITTKAAQQFLLKCSKTGQFRRCHLANPFGGLG